MLNDTLNPVQIAAEGRMFDKLRQLMSDAGCPILTRERDIELARPRWISAKLLKPQGIVEMLAAGRRDIGFAGADWVAELNADSFPCWIPSWIRSTSWPLPLSRYWKTDAYPSGRSSSSEYAQLTSVGCRCEPRRPVRVEPAPPRSST